MTIYCKDHRIKKSGWSHSMAVGVFADGPGNLLGFIFAVLLGHTPAGLLGHHYLPTGLVRHLAALFLRDLAAGLTRHAATRLHRDGHIVAVLTGSLLAVVLWNL